MIKFKLRGMDAEIDENNILTVNNQKFDANYCTQQFAAEVNKALRESSPSDGKRLNIGCGFRPFNNFINLDYDPITYPDIVRDVDEGLPFDSDKFEEIYSSHVIEHVKDVFFFMYEIWRVCKNGAKIKIICPNCNYLNWAVQPDHVRLIHQDYFERWKPEHLSVQSELKQTRGAKFNIIVKRAFNDEKELEFVLEAVK
jgi:predicted SAM-dependent methyltransferase